METKDRWFASFEEHFGPSQEPIRCFYAPGRVNLLGDHTDYNGGLVLPCAVTWGTHLLIRRHDGPEISLRSLNVPGDFHGSQLPDKAQAHWTDYPLGVIHQLGGHELVGGCGFQALFFGDLPQGTGLSSSASLEVVTAFALNSMFEAGYSLLDLVRRCQWAERDFVGVACGIMDQYAVAMAQEDHALQLDCQNLEHQQVPLDLGTYQIIITNSREERQLTGSAYNQRAEDCAQALKFFQEKLSIPCLAALSPGDLEALQSQLPHPRLARRVRHVLEEHRRVSQGARALQEGSLERFGQLMVASHQSLRDDFEVSTPSLDFLVDRGMAIPGVLGSRLTGAGFGGCTVSLVAEDSRARFCEELGDAYLRHSGRQADFLCSQAKAGVREL